MVLLHCILGHVSLELWVACHQQVGAIKLITWAHTKTLIEEGAALVVRGVGVLNFSPVVIHLAPWHLLESNLAAARSVDGVAAP